MFVVEMHNQLYGPFAYHADAYAWGDMNCDLEDRLGKRFSVRNLNTPHEATIDREEA